MPHLQKNVYTTNSYKCMYIMHMKAFKCGTGVLNKEFSQRGSERRVAPAAGERVFLFFLHLQFNQKVRFIKATISSGLTLNLKHIIWTFSECWSTLSDSIRRMQLKKNKKNKWVLSSVEILNLKLDFFFFIMPTVDRWINEDVSYWFKKNTQI